MHCVAAHAVRKCAALPPTHPVTINLYHFKGSVAHRPPLVHTDWPLELIFTATVPLRGHATTVCGVGSTATAETQSSSPLHGRKRMTSCTQIYTARLSDTHSWGLPTSWVLQHGERPWPFFQGQNCRKTVLPTFARLMRGLQDAHTDQKVQPICSQHERGSQGDWDSRESQWKKTYDIEGQTYDIVCQLTMSMFNTT